MTASRTQNTFPRNIVSLDAGPLWDWHIPTGKVIYSEKWCKSLGFEQNEVRPHVNTWKNMVHPDDMEEVFITLNDHLNGKSAQYSCTNRLQMKSGAYRSNLYVGQVIERDVNDFPIRMVGHDTEVAA